MRYDKFGKRSLFALITCAVLLAVFLLNILVTYIASKNILYLDLTKTNYTEITEITEDSLSSIENSDNDITIYFLADKDELQNAGFGYSVEQTGNTSDLWGMKHIYELATVYSEKYDFINVKHLDISEDAELLEKYKLSISMTFNKQKVIVDNAVPEKDENGNTVLDANGEPIVHHNFRIASRDYFYSFDTDSHYVLGFNGELRFTSMIMSVAGQSPVAYFAYGHGEEIGAYEIGSNTATSNEDYGKAQALRDYIYDSGFIVKKIDIASEYNKLLNDENAMLLIVFDPKNDFCGEEAESDNDPSSVNEIDVLRRFANRKNTHLMFFSDPSEDKEEMPNLDAYLYDYWGLSFDNKTVKDSGASSLSSDGSIFMADYETNRLSPGVSLTAGLSALDSLPRIYFANAGTVSINKAFSNEVGITEGYAVKYSGSVFNAPASAIYKDTDTNAAASSLMAITYEKWYESNNETPTYVLACASTDYVCEKALSNQYGNSDVIGYLLKSMQRDLFVFDIEMKEVETEAVEIPSAALLALWNTFIYVIPPITALVLGAIVFIKRKHA